MSYQYWRAALAGEKPKMFVDEPQMGFYRKAVYTKKPNYAAKRIGWAPVAIFGTDNTKMAAAVGAGPDRRVITDRDEINELWSYVAANPIAEATYREVAEQGEPWPDTIAAIEVANSSTLDETFTIIPVQHQNRHQFIAAEIEAHKTLITAFATIDSDEQCAKARALQLRFLELRSEAAKHYEEANRPLLDQQKELRGIWFPIRDSADDLSNTLRRAMGTWEDSKRQAAKDSAERAAAGQEVKSNVPPPSTQIKGGAGRAASVRLEKIVESINVEKVFQQFKDSPDVIKCLTDIAQRAIRAGIEVPGAVITERSVVK